jgi:hypothetical protein
MLVSIEDAGSFRRLPGRFASCCTVVRPAVLVIATELYGGPA